MSTNQPSTPSSDDSRLLETLHRILTLPGIELRPTLDSASTLISEAIDAEKVDVFIYEPEKDSLVALGTSETPMGRLEYQLGLDRFPRSNAGPLTRVFETGEAYFTGHAERDPTQPRGVVEGLGVRSQVDVGVEINGERRGVLAAVSSQPDRFTERDRRFLEAVASWIGLLVHRAELIQNRMDEAAQLGRRAAGEELALLTRRQQEVVACVAEGLTNDEIAERLTLVPGTVANHIEAILRRLTLRNRTSLATWAVEHGLYRSNRDADLSD
jgi:two-component system, OmpR family, sensor kinase